MFCKLQSKWAALAVLMAASFAQNSRAVEYVLSENGNHLMLVGATQAEYNSVFSSLYGTYRITWFNAEYFEPANGLGGHGAADPRVHYSAIFELNVSGVTVSHFYDLSLAGLNEHINSFGGGSDMIQVDSYDNGQGTRYAYIAYHQPGPAYEVIAGVTSDLHQVLQNQLPGDMRLVNRTFGAPLSGLITSLYKVDYKDTLAYSWQSWNELTTLRNTLQPMGYRITSMEIQNFPGLSPLFAPVFKRNGALTFTVPDFHQGFPGDIASVNEGDALGDTPTHIGLENYVYVGGSFGAMPSYQAGWLGAPVVYEGMVGPGSDKFTTEIPDYSQQIDVPDNKVLASPTKTVAERSSEIMSVK